MSYLDDIRTKVRKLTKSPSENQLSNDEIDNKANTFLQLYMPQFFELFELRKTLSFYTYPNIDRYYTNPDSTANGQLKDFKNAVLKVDTPFFIGGYLAYFTLRRSDFYAWVNTVYSKVKIGTGDGITTSFTGTLSSIPVEARAVLFSTVDVNGIPLQFVDRPLISATSPYEGVELTYGNLYNSRSTIPDYPTTLDATNTINYVTGVYTVTFGTAPKSGEDVNIQTIPYKASIPRSILFLEDTFILRPIPDDSYEVKCEVQVRPAELLEGSNESPELDAWWPLIAFGVAKLIFEERLDTNSLEQMMPAYTEQKNLVRSRSTRQVQIQRAPSIYSINSYLTFRPGNYPLLR